MKNKFIQLALVAAFSAASAVPALAQNTNWKLNSDHSTARLSLGSTADPGATFDVAIARVKGAITLDANSLANSSLHFTIFPAGQDSLTVNPDGGINAAEFSNVARSAVITFQSKNVKPIGNGALAVTGNLTLTHLERPVLLDSNEAYAGPIYGEPEVQTTTREVTFVIDQAALAAARSGNSTNVKLLASSDIKTEDFPGLSEAIIAANWPVVVEDQTCRQPQGVGEDYSGSSCTGSPIVVASRAPASQTIADDYPGPDNLATPVHDNVYIALNLELSRDSSTSATASGN